MDRLKKLDELNEKYTQFIFDEVFGQVTVEVSELRQLAKEAGLEDDVNLEGDDKEFLNGLKLFFRRMIQLSER